MLSPEQRAAVDPAMGLNGIHNPEDRGPLTEALWKGVLATGEAIEIEGHRGASRSTAHYSTGPDLEAVSAVYTWYLIDGTRLHRRITVTAVDTVDSNDGYWDRVSPDDIGAVREDGEHYVIGSVAGERGIPDNCKGFAGTRWHIVFKNGLPDVYTDNLWSQGPIPPAHRERLPDNAELHYFGGRATCLACGTDPGMKW